VPTVLVLNGWRLFFYANERDEPIHIHCQKGEKECKFWILVDEYDISLVFSHNMKNPDFKIIRKIIFNHFDDIVSAWNNFQEKK